MFKRRISEKLIEQLFKSDLYKQNISEDIKSGEVFPAIRDKRIDFYYKGGKLFTYDGDFKTHIKFASVYRLDDKEKTYVTEKDLSAPQKCDFKNNYKRIKENCAMFSGQEAIGLSKVNSKYSYINAKTILDAMVLDIEVSFKSDEEDRSQDRIDLLFFKNGVLRFCEAKLFSNSEIWARIGSEPKVAGQVERYKKQIANNEATIIRQYQNYVEIVNKVFDLNVGLPREVDHNVHLLLFGFDNDQLQGKFKKLFEGNLKGKISYYSIGDISKMKINNMWDHLNTCKL